MGSVLFQAVAGLAHQFFFKIVETPRITQAKQPFIVMHSVSWPSIGLLDKIGQRTIQTFKIAIYSRLGMWGQVSHYMSQGYQNSDCFLFDLEPNFAAIPMDNCHRKPSYDDILADLLAPALADPLATPIPPTRRKAKHSPSLGATQRKERRRRENGKTLGVGQQRGHWQADENKRYHWFLELHCSHFLNKHMRRMDKIFKCMERFVATREAEQCRSHHQKMEKKHGTFVCILKELRRQNYGTGDADCIVADMQVNGVECPEELLSWGALHNEMERTDQVDSQKSTINEGSPVDSFVDPIAELNCQYEADLELLIL